MNHFFEIENKRHHFREVVQIVFDKSTKITLSSETKERIISAQKNLMDLFENGIPIYGVTTGFGDSCFRVIPKEKAQTLQKNLVSYLRCGTGPLLDEPSCRAVSVIRLLSLSRGYSGVSLALIERLAQLIESDIYPAIPTEGSLGASGDLVPLAYLAAAVIGEGEVYYKGKITPTSDALESAGIEPYTLQPKEGLAIVNGTSAMAGLALVNIQNAREILDHAILSSAWLCLAIDGKREPFSELVNELANKHSGQARVAQRIRDILDKEEYTPQRARDVSHSNGQTVGYVQDRYSLRCVPQILGPVLESIELAERWIEEEINGVADNPLVSSEGDFANGGNFYGGYICHGMDYLKISLAQVADLMDRQFTLLADEKSNRGLPPNLANWPGLPEEERHLHHGLKGLHQSVSAITSEIMQKSIPNGIFSRSAESHNQDKVSLGMSAAVQCSTLIDALWNVTSLYTTSLAQAIDLKGIQLKSSQSKEVYTLIREQIPFVSSDRALDFNLGKLKTQLTNKIFEH